MTTHGWRILRPLTHFSRTTVTTGLLTVCGGVLLFSAIEAHAARSANGMPCNGVPMNGMPFNGIGPNGVPLNGMPYQGMPRNGLPLHETPLQESARPTGQSDTLPWGTISQQGIGARTP